ncbi:phosphonate ABC transporter, permease protein PhnE [Brucella pseudogrignonensis]|uniref:Phosphonate transport system permease protein n=1 Tax=Brucella pseudogrignonensis TaxID=419475 RepID=A0ABU1MB79_9HYPH|nr:phosphonate ABC transporter, permease protein PhnE [Brucella pseudogrignonensis]MDR6433297.1 phosphonate transport system permease protein [Brucella pseudogrignonensis]
MTVSSLDGNGAKSLLADYRREVGKRRLYGIALLLALVVVAIAASVVADVRLGTLAENLFRFTNYLGRILPELTIANFGADMANWYWNIGGWLKMLFETLLIAYLATLIGGVIAFGACFAASSNMAPNSTVRFVVRRGLELLRTVPEIVFALLFVIAFGLGPMAGVLALMLHTTGALGKLFSEVVENIDMRPVEGIRASGGSGFQVIRFAVLPQVAANFASYGLLRFEINVRGASVMGFVGAGGIGQELLTSIRQFYYSDVSAILLLIIVTIVAIDLITQRIRHALLGRIG